MTTTRIYQNRRNPNKYIEVRNDGWYHNSVRQFIGYKTFTDEMYLNLLGDRCLHRWRKQNLQELLQDYIEVEVRLQDYKKLEW